MASCILHLVWNVACKWFQVPRPLPSHKAQKEPIKGSSEGVHLLWKIVHTSVVKSRNFAKCSVLHWFELCVVQPSLVQVFSFHTPFFWRRFVAGYAGWNHACAGKSEYTIVESNNVECVGSVRMHSTIESRVSCRKPRKAKDLFFPQTTHIESVAEWYLLKRECCSRQYASLSRIWPGDKVARSDRRESECHYRKSAKEKDVGCKK